MKSELESVKAQKEEISLQIQDLLEKRKEIDRQLRKLRDVSIYNGCARMAVDSRRHQTPIYSLSIRYEMFAGGGRWSPVFWSEEKKEILNVIPEIINDLQGLREKIQEDCEGQS